MSSDKIQHSGIVVGVSGDFVDVVVKAQPACVGCKAKAVCGMDESDEIVVSVETSYASTYSVDEEVAVSIKKIMGIKAVLYAYILPFLFVLLTLVILLQSGVGELVSGLISLGILLIYYFLLYLLRERLEKEIIFEIEKL